MRKQLTITYYYIQCCSFQYIRGGGRQYALSAISVNKNTSNPGVTIQIISFIEKIIYFSYFCPDIVAS